MARAPNMKSEDRMENTNISLCTCGWYNETQWRMGPEHALFVTPARVIAWSEMRLLTTHTSTCSAGAQRSGFVISHGGVDA